MCSSDLWLKKTVELPIDEDLFLEKLNALRASSVKKETVQEATFDTAGSYGSQAPKL